MSVPVVQTPLSHHQLEAIQRSAQCAGLTDHLAGQRHGWFAAASGKRGHSPKFSDAAIQYGLTIKPLWIDLAADHMLCSDTTGVVWTAVTSSRLQHVVQPLTQSYRSSSAGLRLLVDSTGIKFLDEAEWKCKKHGQSVAAKLPNCTFEPPSPIGLLNWAARRRWLWPSRAWGWGNLAWG